MKLEQKRVLLTGGTAGIGRALTQLLVERGARVFICGRDGGRLDATLASLPGVGGCVCDVARAEELPALMEQAVEQLGGLDLLVNNAGIQLSWDLAEEAAAGPEALARVSLDRGRHEPGRADSVNVPGAAPPAARRGASHR
jgi:short-subunit dehydrogenase involved in D-alanine esterification of teichoic acids